MPRHLYNVRVEGEQVSANIIGWPKAVNKGRM